MIKYKTPLGSNWGWYSNPEVDEMAEKALASTDPAVWEPLVTRIHEIIVKEARNLFIVSDLNPRAMSPRVKGFIQAQSWFQDITPIVMAPN
jgi:peptide/nickel transport system substrate-binding protein